MCQIAEEQRGPRGPADASRSARDQGIRESLKDLFPEHECGYAHSNLVPVEHGLPHLWCRLAIDRFIPNGISFAEVHSVKNSVVTELAHHLGHRLQTSSHDASKNDLDTVVARQG